MEVKDMTMDLKVEKVTLLTAEQAKQLPKEERRATCSWWLRTPGLVKEIPFPRAGVVINGNINPGGEPVDYTGIGCGFMGIRPALLIASTSPFILTPGEKFIYKGLKWRMCPFTEDGCMVALGTDVLRDDNGRVIGTPFKKISFRDGNYVDLENDGKVIEKKDATDYEQSTVKKVLEKWAVDKGIIKAAGDSSEETGSADEKAEAAVTDAEKLIQKANASGIIDRDVSSEYMAGLLMDDNWSTYKMYEDLVRMWLKGDGEYRKGMDDALMTLTGWSLTSITTGILEQAKENGTELDGEIEALIAKVKEA